MHMTIVHPIDRAWITTGGTGAQNYDEFADDAEITAIIADNPRSALAVEMPHLAPETLGRSFADSLPAAAERLAEAKAAGSYASAEQVIVLYRIADPDGGNAAYGMYCMVDTDQISTSPDEPGLVIRNEDVFIEKVRERVDLANTLRNLLSPVLLLQTGTGDRLHEELEYAIAHAGEPAATDVDPAGRVHAIWTVPAGSVRDELCALAGAGELVVADGNHRSLAAQTGGYPRFLAVITTPESLVIAPYNRLIKLPIAAGELADRLRAAGLQPEPAAGGPAVPPTGGTIQLYVGGETWSVKLPSHGGGDPVEGMDHALVERVLVNEVLGLDAGDKRIVYVGGDYPAEWLRGEVDAGRADLAVLIAPVTMDEFVAVNLARRKMPRKSTWFTPKARGGLVVAEI
ncbi:DUF1015 family protein [Catenuloplanes niger JCM 9533]